LETEIARLNSEKNDVHNQSVQVAEETQQKQHKIQQLEAVSYRALPFYSAIFNVYFLMLKC